jgi:hypothetical protein
MGRGCRSHYFFNKITLTDEHDFEDLCSSLKFLRPRPESHPRLKRRQATWDEDAGFLFFAHNFTDSTIPISSSSEAQTNDIGLGLKFLHPRPKPQGYRFRRGRVIRENNHGDNFLCGWLKSHPFFFEI